MFTAKEYRAMARNKLKGHWLISILVSFVAALLGGVSGGGGMAGGVAGSSSVRAAQSEMGDTGALMESIESILQNPVVMATILSILGVSLLISLALFIIGGAVELGHNSYYIDLCRSTEPGFDALFGRFRIFLKALGLRLFMALFIILWSMLLFVPGIIATYRYAMAPYIMAQNPEMGIREAVNRSKEMMRGRKWKFFCLELSFIGWAILCAFTLGIGTLWLSPYMNAAAAAFYLDASGQGIPLDPQSAV